MTSNSGLAVKNVSVSYGQHQALNDVSLQVKPGEIVVILGANGAGKSTLLKTIAGLVNRTTGSIEMNGVVTSSFRAHYVVEAGIALVPEGRGIFGDLSVEENLTLGAYSKRSRDGESERLQQVYRLFPKLVERRHQIARTMSGGEQQMVAIGRAIMSAPTILMLDEPSLGLSPLLASEVFKTLKAVRDTGLGILLVEQNAKQSLAIADRGYLLENGQIVAHNSASALLQDDAVRNAYLGGASAQTSTSAKTATLSIPSKHSADANELPEKNWPGSTAASRQSAEALIGGDSIDDWVESASIRQRQYWQSQPSDSLTSASKISTSESEGGLAAMLARMEASAKSATTQAVQTQKKKV